MQQGSRAWGCEGACYEIPGGYPHILAWRKWGGENHCDRKCDGMY